jgi:hypothetical protein
MEDPALGTVVGRSVVYLHKKTDGSVSLAPLVDPDTQLKLMRK